MISNPFRASVAPEFLAAVRAGVRRVPEYLRRRADELRDEGRVGPLAVEPDRIAASIRGTRTYRTAWLWEQGEAKPSCTCPAAPWCPHVVALADTIARQLPPDARGASDADSSRPRPPAAEADARIAGDLASWARRRGEGHTRTLRAVLGLERDGLGDVVPWLEARLTDPRHDDAPRTSRQIHQLEAELRQHPSLLAPPHARLLRVLAKTLPIARGADTTRHRLETGGVHRLLDSFAGSPLVTWSLGGATGAPGPGGVRDGQRLRLGDDVVDLVPTSTGEGTDLAVALAARWPDGATRRLDEVVFVETSDDLNPSLVLADGAFWRVAEAPPTHVIRRLTRGAGLAVPEVGREEFLAALASSFSSVGDALGEHMLVHPATPLVTLELGADDWLRVRLFAHTPAPGWRPGSAAPGVVAFELNDRAEWVKLDAAGGAAPAGEALGSMEARDADGVGTAGPEPPAAGAGAPPAGPAAPVDPSDVWIEIPDPGPLVPVREWLATLPFARSGRRLEQRRRRDPASADRGLWILLGASRIHELGHAWERRPRHAVYLGNERMRNLLSGRHIVRTRLTLRSSGTDWFSVSAEWRAEGIALTEADLAKLRASSSRYVKLSSGWASREWVESFDAEAALLADLGVEVGGGEQRLSLAQLAQARPESLAALETLDADDRTLGEVAALRERIREFRGLPRVEPPAKLRGTLRHYQRDGLDFLAFVTGLGMGAVLADDMGLGKTVQALAWIEWLRERDPSGGPVLVVCPASVVHNWQREAARFTPDLRVLVLASGEERHALRREVPAHDLVITNYALLRRDVEHWERIPLRAAILDEAQNIKNPRAAVSQAVLRLDTRHRLALTGTPIENRALDLWSILHFVNPGYLGRRSDFVARYDAPDSPAFTRRLLAAKLRPVMIRRLKEQVEPELPDRIEERLECALTPGQRRLYLAELMRGREAFERLKREPGGVRGHRIEVLALLTRLRQICCHPALVGGREDLGSGKFDALFELLEPLIAEGRKVLLFSQFVECLKLLGAAMKRRGLRHHVLIGATTQREKVVAAFENDPEPCVFLISLKAGGTGLNLVAAQYVVVFDPWWNPAVEDQAIDRAHRIGQTRAVIAYRLMAEGTVEEKIWQLQQRKQRLVKEVLGEDGFARALTPGDLEYLLG